MGRLKAEQGMGGPCKIRSGDALIEGPECTDNFQIAPFEYAGRTWQSVEQAYQALKWGDDHSLDAWEKELPEQAESAFAYGNRMWQLARTMKSGELVADFDAIKVEVMYLLNCAKYAQNSALQQQLLATGEDPIVGGKSTWNWAKYNGLIQRLVRHRLRQGPSIVKLDDTAQLLQALESMAAPDEGSRFFQPDLSADEQTALEQQYPLLFELKYMELKQHVIDSLGCEAAEVDSCVDKYQLVQLLAPAAAASGEGEVLGLAEMDTAPDDIEDGFVTPPGPRVPGMW